MFCLGKLKCDGKIYRKGQKFSGSEEQAELLLKKGVLVEKMPVKAKPPKSETKAQKKAKVKGKK